MDILDFADCKRAYPDAVDIWHMKMLLLTKEQLIETLLVHMHREVLEGVLMQIALTEEIRKPS